MEICKGKLNFEEPLLRNGNILKLHLKHKNIEMDVIHLCMYWERMSYHWYCSTLEKRQLTNISGNLA